MQRVPAQIRVVKILDQKSIHLDFNLKGKFWNRFGNVLAYSMTERLVENFSYLEINPRNIISFQDFLMWQLYRTVLCQQLALSMISFIWGQFN